MTRFDRLLQVAKCATPERLERVEHILYPYAAQGMQEGKLLDSQLEALFKVLSATSGIGVRAITKSYRAVAKANPERNQGVERAGPYLIENGCICVEKDTRDGPVTTPLCNFTARITEERERDDGVERTRTFVITGGLANGRALLEAEVAAPQFATMNWPVAAWGTRAVVYAGQGTKDHLRAAVQMLSGDAPRRITYTHLGWREIEGRMVYLHAGGVIAPAAPDAPLNVQVETPQGLERFILPEPPTGDALVRAVRASFGVLDLAPDGVTVPLLGMPYRALYGGVDFGGHLVGQTGAGKSELAAVMQQHYGAGLDSRHLPGSWSSTANALEGLVFAGKDVLITIDDFAPEGSSHDIQRYHATAARLFRAQGNGASRGRMRADGSLRPSKPPRGFVLSTGEDIPKGHLIKARALILELEPRGLDWKRLTEAQQLASCGIYAAAMAGFIAWIAEDYDGRTAAFRDDYAHFRSTLQQHGHKRTVDAGAQLLATYKSLLAFAREVGALTETECVTQWERVNAGIQIALEPQATLQAQSDPVARFGELLTGLFVSGRAHVDDAMTGDYPGEGWGWEAFAVYSATEGNMARYRPKGTRIGWVDGDNLYLEPSVTYAELQRFARDQGESVPLTERTLWKRLAERGMILSREASHLTVKRSVHGNGRPRVLHLSATDHLSGATGASRTDAVQDGITVLSVQGQENAGLGQVGQRSAGQAPPSECAPLRSGAEGVSGAQEGPSDTVLIPLAPVAPLSKRVEAAQSKGKPQNRWAVEL